MMDSDSTDGSDPPTDGQEGRGQAELGEEEEQEETSGRDLVDGDPSECDDDDDDDAIDEDDANDEDDDDNDDQSKQNSTKDVFTASRGANKSSSLGNSNKRPRHHHDKRDDCIVKDSDKLMVEWDNLADGPLGDVPLTRNIPFIERDNLLGWATHITQATRRDDNDNDSVNPLAGLPNVPLPASTLFLLHEAAGEHLLVVDKDQKHEKQQQQLPSILERFDQSALVALGMVLEEAITSSLLPLARAHVARCRRLEQEEEESSHLPTSTCREFPTFREWTLPPADAVAKLQEYKNSATSSAGTKIETALPSTHCPPNRNALANDAFEEEESSTAMQMPLDEQAHHDALDRWCQAHGLEVDFVLKNMDILGSLVSTKCPPR